MLDNYKKNINNINLLVYYLIGLTIIIYIILIILNVLENEDLYKIIISIIVGIYIFISVLLFIYSLSHDYVFVHFSNERNIKMGYFYDNVIFLFIITNLLFLSIVSLYWDSLTITTKNTVLIVSIVVSTIFFLYYIRQNPTNEEIINKLKGEDDIKNKVNELTGLYNVNLEEASEDNIHGKSISEIVS